MSSISRRERRDQAAEFLKNVADQSFPNSKKVYVPGKIHDIRVAMREITLSDTLISGNKDNPSYEKNQPLCVYDTSGFYTDNAVDIDVHKGIPRLRDSWIESRDDVEFLQEKTSTYSQQRLADEGLDHIRFEHLPKVRKAKKGKNVTQMHYARQGITNADTIFCYRRLLIKVHILVVRFTKSTAYRFTNNRCIREYRSLSNTTYCIRSYPYFKLCFIAITNINMLGIFTIS